MGTATASAAEWTGRTDVPVLAQTGLGLAMARPEELAAVAPDLAMELPAADPVAAMGHPARVPALTDLGLVSSTALADHWPAPGLAQGLAAAKAGPVQQPEHRSVWPGTEAGHRSACWPRRRQLAASAEPPATALGSVLACSEPLDPGQWWCNRPEPARTARYR